MRDKAEPLIAHSLRLDVGFVIQQDEVLIDALENIQFMLAVVDCVNGTAQVEKRLDGKTEFVSVSETFDEKHERTKRLRPHLKSEEMEDVFGVEVCLGLTLSAGFPSLDVGEIRYVRDLPANLSNLAD